MKRRDVVKGGLAALAVGATGLGRLTPAQAQTKMVLKASDVHPLGYPTVESVVRMGKKLDAATNGRLTIQMFPSMQLGGEKEAIEQAQVGALQIARISVGAVGPVVDDVNVFNMPFVFRDSKHMEAVLDGEIGAELLNKITVNEKTGLVALGWMNAGSRNIYNSKRPIKSLADLKGLKIRMIGNPLFIDTMNALGGNGVAMGFDQVFSAMQTGVVDGAENNLPSFVAQNHFQVAKYFSMTEHLIIPELLVFSKASWAKLTPEDQALLKKFGREAQLEQRVLWYEAEKTALDKMKEVGTDIVTSIDKQPFRDAVKPVWDKYGAKYAEMTKRIAAVS
ncbi:tripartite ATP-independent transporter solute receptor, DctP family [Bradyrhizobium sp. NFR13]|jgi:tripartite ATP-independent transporter DctP family solute receptor|uniref:TRAP transporter substrate-binding protein n=1 Tax=Bradyrhizobium sp. NFR13 TaxID=1566285 RepID=UPI0008ECA316|nr:TRAP transporter substrate-binding protein [Bradyrhizobium sp. NFR13]SFL81014.1 tripartite ATP-independent transporter solute receptor, DctP family [Bradyrhizobium sp. NFR13]